MLKFITSPCGCRLVCHRDKVLCTYRLKAIGEWVVYHGKLAGELFTREHDVQHALKTAYNSPAAMFDSIAEVGGS